MATELAGVSDEAKLRSSISRAYYAAFCSARNYMLNHDRKKLPYDGSEHSFIVDYYMGYKGHNPTRDRIKIAQELKRMKHERKKADYDDILPDPHRLQYTAKDVIERSERVVSKIEAGSL